MDDFWLDLLAIYDKNRFRIKRALHLKGNGVYRLLNFCKDSDGNLSYENLCCLALVFANVLKSRLPEHIHIRMALGQSNKWVGQYVQYTESLRPNRFWIFNTNHNNFKNRTLGNDGSVRRLASK